MVRVANRGGDAGLLPRLGKAVLSPEYRTALKGLNVVCDSIHTHKDAPPSFWISAPRDFDFASFFEKAFGGAIPAEIEWEVWSKSRFDGCVAVAAKICLSPFGLDALLENITDPEIAQRNIQAMRRYAAGVAIGYHCEFIKSMVAVEAMKIMLSDSRFTKAYADREEQIRMEDSRGM